MERYDLMGTPTASSEEAGVLRIASEVDEKNCGCVDAAITPSNLYNLLGCRKANTMYVGNEVVACPYQPGLLLKCVQAGSTAVGSLDTTNVTSGQVIEDGGVKWEVIAKAIIDAFISGQNIILKFADNSTKTLTTQDTTGYHTGNATSIGGASATKPAVVVTSYRSGNSWYRKYSDGWVEQGGRAGSTSSRYGQQTVTLPVAMANSTYTLTTSCMNDGSDDFRGSCIVSATQVKIGWDNTQLAHWYVCGKHA